MNINNVLGFGLSIQKSNQKLVLVFKLYTLSRMFLILVISNTTIQYFFHSQCNTGLTVYLVHVQITKAYYLQRWLLFFLVFF